MRHTMQLYPELECPKNALIHDPYTHKKGLLLYAHATLLKLVDNASFYSGASPLQTHTG